jgi:hypothetical protein
VNRLAYPSRIRVPRRPHDRYAAIIAALHLSVDEVVEGFTVVDKSMQTLMAWALLAGSAAGSAVLGTAGGQAGVRWRRSLLRHGELRPGAVVVAPVSRLVRHDLTRRCGRARCVREESDGMCDVSGVEAVLLRMRCAAQGDPRVIM